MALSSKKITRTRPDRNLDNTCRFTNTVHQTVAQSIALS